MQVPFLTRQFNDKFITLYLSPSLWQDYYSQDYLPRLTPFYENLYYYAHDYVAF